MTVPIVSRERVLQAFKDEVRHRRWTCDADDAAVHVAAALCIPVEAVHQVLPTHAEKVQWMAVWAARNGLQLVLEGECGFGRDCVGIAVDGKYPDYEWHDKGWNRADRNGAVWTPPDAYHKHSCVAVLGCGERAEAQLYEWLRWFDEHGFKLETGEQPMQDGLGLLGLALGKNWYARLVKPEQP